MARSQARALHRASAPSARAAADEAPAGTFAALRVRNYRLYFAGQAISLTGTWMQSVALSWLVFELTHSGTAIGLVLAAQFLSADRDRYRC